jgi:hypothetical protein
MGPTEQVILALPAVETVAPIASVEVIGTSASPELVVSRPALVAEEAIVAGSSADAIVAGMAVRGNPARRFRSGRRSLPHQKPRGRRRCPLAALSVVGEAV